MKLSKKTQKKSFEKEKGITLIALVITIIVLLILAGVSIATLTGENGILTRANDAVIKNDNATVAEAIRLKLLEFTANKETNEETASGGLEYLRNEGIIDGSGVVNIQELLNQTLKTGNGSNKKDVYIIEDNHLYYYDEDGNPTDLGELGDLDEVLEETDPKLFSITSDGTISVKNRGEYYSEKEWTVENVVIPSEIDGIKVRKIAENMFASGRGNPVGQGEIVIYESFRKIKSIVLPEGIEEIGEGAFENCRKLEKIVLPESLIKIGVASFVNCTSLNNITIPNSVQEIGGACFQVCTSLKNITLPDNMQQIPEYTFYLCTNLENITVPNSVTTIGEAAFMGCVNLKNINIPSSVSNIGAMAFMVCDRIENIEVDANNPNYSSINGSLFDKTGETLIQYALGKTDKSYTIPQGVKTIKLGAFLNYGKFLLGDFNGTDGIEFNTTGKISDLTEVIIPETVNTIENGAFAYLENVKEITIPSSVTTMGAGNFEGWTSSQTIHVPFSSEDSRPSGWEAEWNVGEAQIDYLQ